MSKFEVGDKVRLRNDLTVEEMNTSPGLVDEMWYIVQRGAIVTIGEFTTESHLKLTEGTWFYDPDWFELVERKQLHDFEIGDWVKMVEKAEGIIFTNVGKTYKIVDESSEGYEIEVSGGITQEFNKDSYRLGKFEKVEQKNIELTLDEIADKFNMPVEHIKIKK